MNRFGWTALALATACSGDKGGETGDTGMTMSTMSTMSMGEISEADRAIADQLWIDIAGYDLWSTPPGWDTTPVLSGNHMSNYVVTYWNDPLIGWDLTGTAPDGAIGVKDGFGDAAGATLDNITVIDKRPGYDAMHGDWFYAEYAPDGSLLAAGAVQMCVDCHSHATTDYIYSDPPVGM